MPAGPVIISVLGDVRNLQRSLQDATSGVDRFADGVKSVGKKMTIGLTLPLTALGGVAIKAGADLGGAIWRARLVFGKGADVMINWAEKMDATFGFTRAQALDLAANLALIGKDAKFSGQQMREATERAAELAATFSRPVDDAITAFQSALIGQFEPLQKFGIGIRAADVEAKALALGLIKTKAEMNSAARQTATLALLMDKTAFAVGSAADNAGGFGGNLVILKGQLGRAAEEIGLRMIPVAIGLAQKLSGLIGMFSNLSSGTQQFIIISAILVAAIGPVLTVIGNLIVAIKAVQTAMLFLAANPIVLVIAALVALGAGLFILWKKSETFQNIVTGAFDLVRRGVQAMWNVVRPILETMINLIDRIIGAAGKVTGVVSGIAGKIGGLLPFEHGGIVPGAPGQPVPILAHGGERVVPRGGAPITINVASQADPQMIARELAWTMRTAGT